MSFRQLQARKGFTLLELMLAMLIMATMALIVYSTFTNVANTSELARSTAADLRFRQFISRNISINLASVYMDQAGEEAAYRFIGESEDGPFGPADSLEFTTMLEMPGATALPGIIKRVRYSVVEPGESEGESLDSFAIDTRFSEGNELMLQIYEAPLIIDEKEFGFDAGAAEDEAIIRQVPVRSLDISYYDNESEEWEDEWDSTAKKRLPWAVRIQINLARSADDERADAQQGFSLDDDVDIDMSFSIPVAAGVTTPFVDFNHTRTSFFQESADSMFRRDR